MNNDTTPAQLPTTDDWKQLINTLPIEEVNIDSNGHYDPTQAPSFHDWMING